MHCVKMCLVVETRFLYKALSFFSGIQQTSNGEDVTRPAKMLSQVKKPPLPGANHLPLEHQGPYLSTVAPMGGCTANYNTFEDGKLSLGKNLVVTRYVNFTWEYPNLAWKSEKGSFMLKNPWVGPMSMGNPQLYPGRGSNLPWRIPSCHLGQVNLAWGMPRLCLEIREISLEKCWLPPGLDQFNIGNPQVWLRKGLYLAWEKPRQFRFHVGENHIWTPAMPIILTPKHITYGEIHFPTFLQHLSYGSSGDSPGMGWRIPRFWEFPTG
ncbi:hypothetical protein EDC04DRAFT_2603368 [Pisolithus marmoratus]|nr:hypothetical protein EDC04DRAFT_2603368 [Pisolithus marmoratus]